MNKTLLTILRSLSNLNQDELECVEWIVEGLAKGRKLYGPLDLKTDPRKFIVESMEEQRDSAIYNFCGLKQLLGLYDVLSPIKTITDD